LSGRSCKKGFLIWGRVDENSSALPKQKQTPKILPWTNTRIPPAPDPPITSLPPYPLQETEEDVDGLLTHFSGEPQIVNELTVSQLTSALPRAATALSMSTTAATTHSTKTTTADLFKGT